MSLLEIVPGQLYVIKRNGDRVEFDLNKIKAALKKVFVEVDGDEVAASSVVLEEIDHIASFVKSKVEKVLTGGGILHIEEIQDYVELGLMRLSRHQIAKAYILYRAKRNDERTPETTLVDPAENSIESKIKQILFTARNAAEYAEHDVDLNDVIIEAAQGVYNNITDEGIRELVVMALRSNIERGIEYSYIAAQVAIHNSFADAADVLETELCFDEAKLFPQIIQTGVTLGRYATELLTDFDLKELSNAIRIDRNKLFTYLSYTTLYDRYFVHYNLKRFETPQVMFMRVAMGLSLNESDKTAKAIEFYNVLSQMDYMSSTPTLFNAGTVRPQLSSCFLTTIPDDLYGIYSGLRDNAMLSKWSGGIGNDWTPVRALNSHIEGTNGKSQGVVPFLKVNNDTAVAVNQCFAPDTPVYVKDGVKDISQIVKGDLVLGISGKYRAVLETMEYDQKESPMVEISFKHGEKPVKVTENHPFYVMRGYPKGGRFKEDKVTYEWVDAKDLTSDDLVAQVMPTEILVDSMVGSLDARLIGIILGDGHGTSDGYEWGVTGSSENDDVLSFVINYLKANDIHYWISGDSGNIQVRWSGGNFKFKREDFYTATGEKYISSRFMHLPLDQTKELIRGLMITDGCVSRGKEVTFYSTSETLIRGVKYQLLRLGIPCGYGVRDRIHDHTAMCVTGKIIKFDCQTTEYVLRVPATVTIADILDVHELTKYNWIIQDNKLFTRVKSVTSTIPVEKVYDLIVEGDESYMITSALAHNGGKRKGAFCAYLETWHLDIEEFLELRKNTGDDRRRTHDMNTANWIPDLFMIRMMRDGDWTLFTPSEVPDLHELYGNEFVSRYEHYESIAKEKGMLHKVVKAKDLWRKMLSMLFETGHPWMTFKDVCNLRSPQQHSGVVHSSNLCCVAADQLVVTDIGLKRVIDLYRSGYKPKVAGRNKEINQASEMLLPRPDAPMVMIHTKEGYTHKVTPDHRVWVVGKGQVEAQHLVEGDKLEIQTIGIYGTNAGPEDINEAITVDLEEGKISSTVWEAPKELQEKYFMYMVDTTFTIYQLPYVRELQILALNLGHTTKIDHTFIEEDKKSTYRLSFYRNNGSVPYATFTRLEPLDNEDAYCLTVESEDHAWTVNGFITHNTEITLNTSEDEIAVCNLGSINLVNHILPGTDKLDLVKLEKTVSTAIRMLDNVIDINYYPVPQARNSNLKHRPIGLGIMGFHDALYKMNIAYNSELAVDWADYSMEYISYFAIRASSRLAVERGSYPSYEGSLWSKGILPLDSIELVKATRPEDMFYQDTSSKILSADWDILRRFIQSNGMRNSNVMAIAPTATISNICGVSQSIEPTFKNLYVKSNLSGEYTVINQYLVDKLKSLGLWNKVTVRDLKLYDGEIDQIVYIPQEVKDLFRTAFGVEPKYIIDAASRRQKWVDQAQSLNLYISGVNGKLLDKVYKTAWLCGLKTTYYLRALSATQAEKSTVDSTALRAVKVDVSDAPQVVKDTVLANADFLEGVDANDVPKACSIDNPDCEACQ